MHIEMFNGELHLPAGIGRSDRLKTVKFKQMKTISVTEFRKNLKKYLDLANTEKLVVHRKSEAYIVLPLEELTKDTDLLSEDQKRAIDEAILDVEENRFFSHEEAMRTIGERAPKYFSKK